MIGTRLRATARRWRARLIRGGEVSANDLDLCDPEICQDPFPLYQVLQRKGSVHFRSTHGSWIVFGYDDVLSVLSQPEKFSSSPQSSHDPNLVGADPPAHTAIRRAFARELAETFPLVVPNTESTAIRLLRELAPRTEFDVVRDFARPLSDSVAAEILGFDEAAVRAIRAVSGEGQQEIDSAYTAIVPTIATLLRERKKLPRWSAVLADSDITQLAPFLGFLWTAASRTTRHVIASTILLLLRYPDARKRVTANDQLRAGFVEEVIRLEPSEHLLPRRTTSEVVLSGVKIPAGAIVKANVAAANRDPLRFTDPDRLIPERTPNPHLGFGGGPHRCAGISIGRAEAVTALRAFLSVVPQFRARQPLPSVRYLAWPNSRTLEGLVIASR